MKLKLKKTTLLLLLLLMTMPLLMCGNVDVTKKGDSNSENDWVKDELLGRVKCVATTVTVYRIDEVGDSTSGDLIDSVCYNSDGYRVEEVNYYGYIYNRFLYTYDADNILMERKEIKYALSKVNSTESEKYSYDDKGQLVETSVLKHYMNGDEDTRGLYRYSYDDRGRLEREEYIDDDVMLAWYLYFYNEKDSLKEVQRLSDVLNNWRQVFIYDERGNRVKYYRVMGEESDGLIEKSYYAYDDEGRKIAEKAFDINGEDVAEMEYKYDDEGRIIERRGHDWRKGSNGEFRIAYVAFDEQGNWVKRDTYRFENPERVEKRVIDYY